jgi:methionine aminotransferase
MTEFRKVHQYNVFSVNHPIQIALANYLKEPSRYLQLSEFYQQKRDVFLNLIKDSRFKFNPSQGTYFQVLDYSGITNEGDIEFSRRMTMENGLASIPISVFNENGLDNKVLRFCFAKKEDTLKKAADILCSI